MPDKAGEEIHIALVEGAQGDLRPAPVRPREVPVGFALEAHRHLGWPAMVEIMQLLDRRHPEIRVGLELVIEPARAALMGADAEEIRAVARASDEGPGNQPAGIVSGAFRRLVLLRGLACSTGTRHQRLLPNPL